MEAFVGHLEITSEVQIQNFGGVRLMNGVCGSPR